MVLLVILSTNFSYWKLKTSKLLLLCTPGFINTKSLSKFKTKHSVDLTAYLDLRQLQIQHNYLTVRVIESTQLLLENYQVDISGVIFQLTHNMRITMSVKFQRHLRIYNKIRRTLRSALSSYWRFLRNIFCNHEIWIDQVMKYSFPNWKTMLRLLIWSLKYSFIQHYLYFQRIVNKKWSTGSN